MQSNQAEHTDLITDPIAEQAAEWVVRLSDNDLSPADHAALLAEFEQWQQVNLCHAEAASKIMTLIRQTEQLRNSVHPASARAAAEAFLSGKRSHSRLKHPGTTLLLVIALVIPAWLFFQHYPPEYMLADMRTSTGQWQSQTLTDSSTIVLSSASAVNFSFNSQQRRLELVRGDIQVDVAADPERPFQVETRNGTIVALGTRFIVELSDNTTTLTMLESEAAVHLAESDFTQSGATTITQTLNAGQQVTFSNGWIGDIETIDIRGISDAWKFRHLVVSNIPLPDVLDQLSRYRSGFIRYNRQKLEKMTVSAVLPVDDTDKALHLLTKSFPIQTHTITP